jgi:hypothetical protein
VLEFWILPTLIPEIRMVDFLLVYDIFCQLFEHEALMHLMIVAGNGCSC